MELNEYLDLCSNIDYVLSDLGVVIPGVKADIAESKSLLETAKQMADSSKERFEETDGLLDKIEVEIREQIGMLEVGRGQFQEVKDMLSEMREIKKSLDERELLYQKTIKKLEAELKKSNKELIAERKYNEELMQMFDGRLKHIELDVSDLNEDYVTMGSFNELKHTVNTILADQMAKSVLRQYDNSPSTSKTSRSQKVSLPRNANKFNLSHIRTVKGEKPLGIYFEDYNKYIAAAHWTDLLDDATEFILSYIAEDDGVDLRESQAKDDWGNYYFYDGRQGGKKYRYIQKHDFSVFYSGSDTVVTTIKEMCKICGIKLGTVQIYYSK